MIYGPAQAGAAPQVAAQERGAAFGGAQMAPMAMGQEYWVYRNLFGKKKMDQKQWVPVGLIGKCFGGADESLKEYPSSGQMGLCLQNM